MELLPVAWTGSGPARVASAHAVPLAVAGVWGPSRMMSRKVQLLAAVRELSEAALALGQGLDDLPQTVLALAPGRACALAVERK